jgi:hypothetical protein
LKNSTRLFITVWLIASVHATTNVVRETYLAIAIGGYGTVRVDRYLGLHPDLFNIPGRGAYINSNPGASILGAAAYSIVHPVIGLAVRMRPSIAAPKPPARYEDPRPNRTLFMNASRARGLDVVLGLAAIGIAVLLMAPLAAFASVVMYRTLRERLQSERPAIFWALVYALATPILFRTAFLNQNVILAHCLLAAWVALAGFSGIAHSDGIAGDRRLRNFLIGGLLLGTGLLCDYSAAPLILVVAAWIISDGLRAGGGVKAARWIGAYVTGVAVPMLVLLAYQWAAFGSPWYPAQRYMPPTEYSVEGWFGFSVPSAELLLGNLFDLRYGLFAFCPLLIAALAAPFIRDRRDGSSSRELFWILAATAGLYLFSSANQFANLQWNTGVRYMVPATPLLFIAAVPVLRRMPRWLTVLLVFASTAVSFAVSMTREDIVTAFSIVLSHGPTLPLLIVLRKMQSGYSTFALPWFTIWVVYAALAFALWLVWRKARRDEPGAAAG